MNTNKKYTNNQILKAIQDLAGRLGQTPSKGQMRQLQLPSEFIIRRRFGSWTKACIAAGLKPNPTGHVPGIGIKRENAGPPIRNTRRKLLNQMQRVAEELGHTPTVHDLYQRGPPYPGSFIRTFGSVRKAAEAAGLTPNKSPRDVLWSDEQLLSHLKQLGKKLGRRPERRDILKAKGPKYTVYFKRFGSFHQALLDAGFKMRRKQ